jgi:hypothetical protein
VILSCDCDLNRAVEALTPQLMISESPLSPKVLLTSSTNFTTTIDDNIEKIEKKDNGDNNLNTSKIIYSVSSSSAVTTYRRSQAQVKRKNL